jgi:hypothetical protein
MRNAILVSVMTVVLIAGASVAFAGPPASGTYKSSLGQFDEGTEASYWPGLNTFLSTGNVLFAQSRDGSGFTSDWVIGCPVVVSVNLENDYTVGGTGQKEYKLIYNGGYVTLGGPGMPWDGGDASYTGVVTTYEEFRTILYVAGSMVGSVSDHSVKAAIQGYNDTCVAWGVGNGVWRGNTPTAKPAAYPSFHDANCNVAGATGHWSDTRDLTISVSGCSVAVEQSTWGAVKSLYRD